MEAAVGRVVAKEQRVGCSSLREGRRERLGEDVVIVYSSLKDRGVVWEVDIA
jgi:hypothetical protein